MAYIIAFFVLFALFISLMSFTILGVPKTKIIFEFVTMEIENVDEYMNGYFSFLLSGLSKDYIIEK